MVAQLTINASESEHIDEECLDLLVLYPHRYGAVTVLRQIFSTGRSTSPASNVSGS